MPRVDNDGVAIHYRIEGSGSPLILQHGFTDSSETLYELGYVDALKTKHRIILPDTRGHGLSDKPHDTKAYTPASFASDIVAVLNDAGVQKTAYWGYSQGGWIAFALARYAIKESPALLSVALQALVQRIRQKRDRTTPLSRSFSAGPERRPVYWASGSLPRLNGVSVQTTRPHFASRRQRLVTEGYSDIRKIAVPTLLYAGSADPIHGAARQSASQIPGATFISLPGLDHVAAMCQPRLILPQVQEFLERIDPSS
jgi:pimeloyl-ACP methyl ester carboxylesterase